MVDGKETLITSITPEDACNKDVIWSSSNTNVAIVDSLGKVTGIKPGDALIMARTVECDFNSKL